MISKITEVRKTSFRYALSYQLLTGNKITLKASAKVRRPEYIGENNQRAAISVLSVVV